MKQENLLKSSHDETRPDVSGRPPLCVCVWVCERVCINLSSGLSAIITSCGLITTLPKKSHDLKVMITWHPPPPRPLPFLPLWKPWQQPAGTSLWHTASFCVQGVFRVQVEKGGKMEVGSKIHPCWLRSYQKRRWNCFSKPSNTKLTENKLSMPSIWN